jgi:hypothetical protein
MLSTEKFKNLLIKVRIYNTMISQLAIFLCVFWCYVLRWINVFLMLLRVYIHTGQAEKLAWPRWESNPRSLVYYKLSYEAKWPSLFGCVVFWNYV